MTSQSQFAGAGRMSTRTALALAFVLAPLATGCRETARAGTPPPPAPSAPRARETTSAPEKVRYAPRISATGTLKPLQLAMLSPSIPGTIERIVVKRAQEVQEGAVLMTLESAAARATLAQAQAGLMAAEAQDRMAQDGLARVTAIKKGEGGVTDMQVAQVQGQRDQAAAGLAAAKAQLQQAEVHLRNHTLRAPFAGMVTKVPDGIGSVVGPGAPLVMLQVNRTLVLETSLTQAEATEVAVGAKVVVSVPATGARTEDAVVRAVVPMVDPGTGRVPVEITVPNTDGRFLAFAFARVEIGGGGEREALKLASGALVQKEGGFSVWVVGPEGKASLRPVKLLGQDGDRALVVAPADWPAGSRVIDAPTAVQSEAGR